MIPVLLNLKFIKIYTFGVFLVLAFFWGMFLMWRNIKLTSYKEEDIFDGFFTSLFGVMFFSRIFYVAQHFKDFGFDVMRFILINGYPGLSLFGALFGGFISLFIFCKSRKMSFTHLVDYLVGPIFLALVIAKIGSFFGGIDVGQKTNFIIATKYLGVDGLRHPIALYEALFFAFGVYFSFKILMSIRKNILSEGFSFYFFIFYFALTNLLLDKLKVHQLYFFGASFNLWVAGALVIIFGIYFLVIFRKNLIHYGSQTFKIFSKRTKGETS